MTSFGETLPESGPKLDTFSRILAFNADREPERLAFKFRAMRRDPLAFLRGTCHLFYADLTPGELPASPLVWSCGDLHLQNFGTYKGENRLTYFDVNDFDEACLAPAAWELLRFLTSVNAAGQSLGWDRATTRGLAEAFLAGYTAALRTGRARWLERATACGLIRTLLTRLKKRTRKRFLAKRSVKVDGRRKLRLDGVQRLPLKAGQRNMLRQLLRDFAETQPDPDFFRLVDAARRAAGNASLGLERYVLLVEGRGSPEGNFLLDLKHQPGSSIVAALQIAQPHWASEAQRVAAVQRDVQAMPPALLHGVIWQGRSFTIREFMPTEDRLDVREWAGDPGGCLEAIHTMGKTVAWGHIRASARRGAALPEQLIDLGHSPHWPAKLLAAAREYSRRNQRQWKEFAVAFDDYSRLEKVPRTGM